jgi:predicted CXXCH cytochrome family protein
MNKELSSSQMADPGTSGTSHKWDADVVSPQYGSVMPTNQGLIDHLRADDKITCATCHDPHSNTISPFLRLDNSADALCLDCHAPRNMTSVKTYTGDTLSHPVGVALPQASATYHAAPYDVDGNPQPSDGNTTNDYILLGGTNVSCTSCHGVHYTDSNSGTVDGP